MTTLLQSLEHVFRDAFSQIGIPDSVPILLTEATKDGFGDYQINGAMSAAKALKRNPRELAKQIIDTVYYDNMIEKLELAGPGFINITLSNLYLGNLVSNLTDANNYGAKLTDKDKQIVVVDYSSPNLAKEMHVGHLRSTVIGDALVNILSYIGNTVIRHNHVGDWGTQFGMLIAYMAESIAAGYFEHSISDLEGFYRNAKVRFDEDKAFQDRARQYVVVLQNWLEYNEEGEKVYEYWKTFTAASLQHCQEVYNKLKVGLTLADVIPESKYNSDLSNIVQILEHKQLIKNSNGAKCVFFAEEEFAGGETTPFIVQKSDGGYLYSTTDLAAVKHRIHDLHASRVLYVVDARQSFHFKQLFIVAKKAGLALPGSQLEHVAFGTMMNEEGKPFKTRSGGTVKLIDLIDEAMIRANSIIAKRNLDWTEEDKCKLANILAIAAIKYSDLSKNRTSDYTFSFDKMLAFDGNTAPYLLYAYTRIQSLLRKAGEEFGYILTNSKAHKIIISNTIEHKLALTLARFADNVFLTAKECYPHYLCQYLYNVSVSFMQFYEGCHILKETNLDLLYSRLILSNKVAQIIKQGLMLLGIPIVEKM